MCCMSCWVIPGVASSDIKTISNETWVYAITVLSKSDYCFRLDVKMFDNYGCLNTYCVLKFVAVHRWPAIVTWMIWSTHLVKSFKNIIHNLTVTAINLKHAMSSNFCILKKWPLDTNMQSHRLPNGGSSSYRVTIDHELISAKPTRWRTFWICLTTSVEGVSGHSARNLSMPGFV